MKTFDEMKAEANARWTGFKIKAKCKVREAYNWVVDNKEEASVIFTAGTVLVGGVFKTAKMINRQVCLNKEQKLKDLYVYDRSLGVYHKLKHKLRPSEIQQIDFRRNNGESMVSILTDMRLIK